MRRELAFALVALAATGMAGCSSIAGASTTPAKHTLYDPTKSVVNINGIVPDGVIAGTGMVMSANGLVLTNNHVIADTTSLTAQVDGMGPTYDATVVGVDPTQDVAVIQLANATNLPVTHFDTSGSAAVGDPVTALGNAGGKGGSPARVTGTLTSLDETITVTDEQKTLHEVLNGVLKCSAAIEPGDSGGPLFNAIGDVIGMDTAGPDSAQTSSQFGFAIPIGVAMDVAHQITTGANSPYIEGPHRGALGVRVMSTASGVGVYVDGLDAGSGAGAAGLVRDDVLTSVGGSPVNSTDALNSAMAGRRPGETVAVKWRDATGQSHSANVTLGQGPPA